MKSWMGVLVASAFEFGYAVHFRLAWLVACSVLLVAWACVGLLHGGGAR